MKLMPERTLDTPTRLLRQWADGRRAALADRSQRIALGYLAAVTLAEMLTTFVEPRLGAVVHSALLVLLVTHAAMRWDDPIHRLLLCLAFAPLIRMLSLSLPLAGFPLVSWYFLTSVPLFIAAALLVPILGVSWRSIGISGRDLPLQAAIAMTGLLLGYIEYRILRPEPLVETFSWEQIWLPALILLVSTGFLEELIFRGLLQRTATERLGAFGVTYVAILFAVLHVGYKSLVDVVFVFGAGLFFGVMVARTRSLLGVTLAHGLTNIMLFLVMPFYPGSDPAPGAQAGRQPAPVAQPVVTITAPAAVTETPSPVATVRTALAIENRGKAAAGTQMTATTPAPGETAPTETPSPLPSATAVGGDQSRPAPGLEPEPRAPPRATATPTIAATRTPSPPSPTMTIEAMASLTPPSPTMTIEAMAPLTPTITMPFKVWLLQPLDGELVSENLTLSWSSGIPFVDGGSYEIELWPYDAEPQSLGRTTSTRWEMSRDLPPGIYSWRVRLVNDQGQTVAVSETFTFSWRP